MYDLINTSRTASIADLRYEYRKWLNANDLPKSSAENLLLGESLTNEQRAYLKSFIERWASTPENQR
ncbi:MAG: hypothetical protein ABFS45_21485 [Pseudomonadota bacterium]